MSLTIIGEPPLSANGQGQPSNRIGTIFLNHRTLITLAGIHATQKIAFLNLVNARQVADGLPLLTEADQEDFFNSAVDLIIDDGLIFIRPNPDRMDLAFRADEMLQELVSKRKIQFLFALNPSVRAALKQRGELWRITPLPQTPADMAEMIRQSRNRINGRAIYYYGKSTGTRWLTVDEFSRLAELPDPELLAHLREIRDFAGRHNSHGHPEIAFFLTDNILAGSDLSPLDNPAAKSSLIRGLFQSLRDRFVAAIHPDLLKDNPDYLEWRTRMFAALVGMGSELVTEEALLGLGSEFFMQIEWLPGGHFENGELIFDSLFDEAERHPEDAALRELCDPRAHEFIFNFIREFGDIENINIGRLNSSLSHHEKTIGRRAVYIAELKVAGQEERRVRIIRMQKWNICEHLNNNKDLLRAIMEAEDYTEYILDRRLGCRQLGMNLIPRVTTRKLNERYDGINRNVAGQFIWSTYFERDYIPGFATDKIPLARYINPLYCERLAALMGAAAAPNLIVGRMSQSFHVIFDMGDEVIQEDQGGLPGELIVPDHVGAFTNYLQPLEAFAADYAQTVICRIPYGIDVVRFTDLYLAAFLNKFKRIRDDYRTRHRAFDTLFRHRRRSIEGSFAFRWEKVLERLDQSDPQRLADIIRQSIPRI
jgi:hypothetical protein